jgi:hypothetical protein
VDTSSPDQRNAFVGTDFDAFGAQAAELVAEAKGGKAKVGILYSGPETTNQVQSIKVFRDLIAEKYPDIEIIGDDTILSPGGNRDLVKTTEVARGFLTANPEVDTICRLTGRAGASAAPTPLVKWASNPARSPSSAPTTFRRSRTTWPKGWEFASIAFVGCGWGDGTVEALDAHFNRTLDEEPRSHGQHVYHENP